MNRKKLGHDPRLGGQRDTLGACLVASARNRFVPSSENTENDA
jgi:hypothetical protein